MLVYTYHWYTGIIIHSKTCYCRLLTDFRPADRRALRYGGGGGGVRAGVTLCDRGEGGVKIDQKKRYVIVERPLIVS